MLRSIVLAVATSLVGLVALAPTRPAFGAADAPSCELEGSWAVRYAIPLHWRMNLGVEGGSGQLVWTVLVDRVLQADGTYAETAYVCSRQAPTTHSHVLYGHEAYGSALDEQWLDAGYAAPAHARLQVATVADAGAEGLAFVAEPKAFHYGMAALEDATAAFPARLAEATAAAMPLAADGSVGFRMAAQTGEGWSLPPVNARRSKRASAFTIVGRDVLAASGTVADCDHLTGVAEVALADKRPALQATVVGCSLVGGGSCSRADLGLINKFQPAFQPAPGTVDMVRLARSASCIDVRAAFAQH